MNSRGREDISWDKKYSLFWIRNLIDGRRFTMILPKAVRPKILMTLMQAYL